MLGICHPRDAARMHLVRTIGQPQRADARPHVRERRVLADACAAERLNGIVDDLQRHLRRLDLDHRDLGLGFLVADPVHHVGGLEAQKARAIDLDPRLGNALFPDAVLGDALAEGDAAVHSLYHQLERLLRRADGAHAMVDAARPEAALRDLEPAALAQEDAARRHTHLVEANFHVAVRRVVVAVDVQRALDGHAFGIKRHQDHRLLAVAIFLGVGLAHQDSDLGARVARARRPPLAPVDDVVVAVAGDRTFDVGRVRRGDARFGHQEGRADLAAHQGAKPLVLLFSGAVAVQHFHVTRVGRRAIEDLGRPEKASHFFGAERIFKVGQLLALEVEALVDMGERAARRHEQVPQPCLTGERLELLDDRDWLPAIPRGNLRVVVRDSRAHVLVDEIADAIAEMCLPFRKVEVHFALLPVALN